MTSEMGLFEAGASEGAHACPTDNPRGARHWGAASRHQTSHEGSWCQASMGPALSFFFKLRSTAYRCRPVELWATHCVVQAQRQIHRVLPATNTMVAARFPIKIAALQ